MNPVSPTVVCGSCSYFNAPTAARCAQCNAPLQPLSPAHAAMQAPATGGWTIAPPPPAAQKKTPLWVVIVAVVLFGACATGLAALSESFSQTMIKMSMPTPAPATRVAPVAKPQLAPPLGSTGE